MKACETVLEFCPMLGYTDGSPTQLVIQAQEDGFRSGWRTALEWMYEHRRYKQSLNGKYFSWHDKISQELGEKNELQTVEQNPQCREQGTEG